MNVEEAERGRLESIRPIIFYSMAQKETILSAFEALLKAHFYPLQNQVLSCELIDQDFDLNVYTSSLTLGVSSGEGEDLVFAMPTRAVEKLAAGFFSSELEPDLAKCDGVKMLVGECIVAFSKELSLNQECMLLGAEYPDLNKLGHGYLVIRVSWSGGSFLIFAPSKVCLTFLSLWGRDVQIPDGESLKENLERAIGVEAVTLNAQLNDTEMSLSELESLEIGDVLVLPHRIDELISLNHQLLGAVFDGQIGSNDGFRSLKLVK